MYRADAANRIERNLPAMTAPAGMRDGRPAWRRWFFGNGAAKAGLPVAKTSHVAARNGQFRAANTVPQNWRDFAKRLQARIEQRLASDDERARRFQDYVNSRGQGDGVPPLLLGLRIWVLADGQVVYVDFGGCDEIDAIADLRALLMEGNVGMPPPEMLQPLHLRLSLQAKPQPGD